MPPTWAQATDGAFDDDAYHPLPLGPEDLSYRAKLFSKRMFRKPRHLDIGNAGGPFGSGRATPMG